MRNTKTLIGASLFVMASIVAFAGTRRHQTTQYNYKNSGVCTFYSDTQPCSGGSSLCTVLIGGVNQPIYVASDLTCPTELKTQTP